MRKLLIVGMGVLTCLLLSTSPLAADVVEDFEDGDISNYTATGPIVNAFCSAAAAHDGNLGLEWVGDPAAGEDWLWRYDAEVHNEQGDVISCWAQTSSIGYCRNYFGFGATAAGCYSLVIAPNTGTLILQYNSGYGYSTLASSNQTWMAGYWYRLEVEWGTDGTIVGKLYDNTGTGLLNTVTATHTAYTYGGIAFRYFDGGESGYFDTVTVGGMSPVESLSWGAIKALYK